MKMERLDHLVLTVADIGATCDFYRRVLGMEVVKFGAGRTALRFGSQKINLHPVANAIPLKAFRPMPGSADLCFVSATPLDEVIAHLGACGVEIIEGPSVRAGALGPVTSVYFRDPDMNLIEVSTYVEAAPTMV